MQPIFLCTLALLSCAPVLAAAEPDRLLVENALMFTLVDGQREPFTGYLSVAESGAISAVGVGKAPADIQVRERLDAKGLWVLPGFISAHSHLWQSAFSGIASDQNLEGWLDQLYGVEAPQLDAAGLYALTYRGAVDHLRNGITSAFNFTYTGADPSGGVDRCQLRAALDAGLKVVHGLNARSLGADWTAVQAHQRVGDFLQWAARQPERARYLGTALAGSATYDTAPAGQMQLEADLMRDFALGNQQHYLESPAASSAERLQFAALQAAGMVRPGMVFGHFIHSTPWLVAAAAKAGVAMTWNPLSNGRLGSGMADVLAYQQAGMVVGMGVDGQASADRADPFANMRHGLYQVRAGQQHAGAMSAYDVLRLHTLGSANALGLGAQLGSLQVGKRADFLLLDPRPFAPWHDPYGALVFSAGVENIRQVVVDGRPVKPQALTPALASACSSL